jgi:hypothetical protein
MSNQLYIIDYNIAAHQKLIDELSANGSNWVLLNHYSDGVEQIHNAVSDYQNLHGIHILSHGNVGALYLGNTTLTSGNLEQYKKLLQQIGESLTPEGDIFLYGCNIAQGKVGEDFVNRLAQMTQADIAASDDLTGRDGDWQLELSTGEVLELISDLAIQSNISGNLAIPVGDVFHATSSTILPQYLPVVTGLSDGGFVVVSTSLSPGGTENDVFGQLYDANGNKKGSQFQISYTPDSEWSTSVVALADGGFVAIWDSLDDSFGGGGYIAGQRYSSNGSRIGNEFQINTSEHTATGNSYAANLSDGGFIVVWESVYQGAGGVLGQRFDAIGNQVGNEFLISNNRADEPVVTGLIDGGFVVVWESTKDGSGTRIFGQRFDVEGNEVGTEFQINPHTTHAQNSPVITSLTDGGYVIVWNSVYTFPLASSSEYGYDSSIMGQLYDSNGNVVDDEFSINTNLTYPQSKSSVTHLSDGGFVVTWDAPRWDADNNSEDIGYYDVYGQRFDADGDKVDSEFRIHMNSEVSQHAPVAANLSDGGYVVVWESRERIDSIDDVLGQRYNAISSYKLTQTDISELYVTILNRASEGIGNQFWLSTNLSADGVAKEMLSTLEAQEYFGSSLDTNQGFIEHIYLNTLAKTVDDDSNGISFWVSLLDANQTTRESVIVDLINSVASYAPDGENYNPDDIATVNAYEQFANRVEVSDYTANHLLDIPDNYETALGYENDLIVTHETSTVSAAYSAIDLLFT